MNKLFITLLAILSACNTVEENKPALQAVVIQAAEEAIEHVIEQATGESYEVEISKESEK